MSRYNSSDTGSKVSGVITYIVYFCLLLLWGRGVIHSYKKHSKIDFAVSFIPPWGWYRGAESFWHKDKSTSNNISSTDSINEDIEMACQLIGENDDTGNQPDVNNKIETFSNKIRNYSVNNFLKIKNASSLYIKYNWYAGTDLIEAYKKVSKGESVIFRESNNTKSVYDSLLNYYKIKDIEMVKAYMDSATQHLTPENFEMDKMNEAVEKMNSLQTKRFENLKDAYYRIFGEQFSL